MLNFSLAGYYAQYRVNIPFLFIFKAHPEWFREMVNIDSVYGCLPGLPWCGGRIIGISSHTNPFNSEIYRLRDEYYDLGVTLRHTYTNKLLTPEILMDYRSNLWTQACEKAGNSIIVSDAQVKKYLQEKYPKYSFIWSTCLCCQDIDVINDLSKNELLVLDYNYNTSNIFSKIKYPENIEILLSEDCPPGCSYRKTHYDKESAYILNNEKDRYADRTCQYYSKHPRQPNGLKMFNCILQNNSATLSFEKIKALHDNYGITHFKLAGRDYHEIMYVESLMYYLIKDEYRDYVRELLLTEIFRKENL